MGGMAPKGRATLGEKHIKNQMITTMASGKREAEHKMVRRDMRNLSPGGKNLGTLVKDLGQQED